MNLIVSLKLKNHFNKNKSLTVYANHVLLGFYLCQARKYQTYLQHIHKNFFSSPKETKNSRLITRMRELKNLEDTIEEINKTGELEAEIIIEFTKRKLTPIKKV